jgi:hypothetical protein
MSITLDLNGSEVGVEYSATVYHPPRLTGDPDFWCPAEGGEVEIEEVTFETSGYALIDGKWIKLERVRVDVMPILPDSEIERFQEEIANLDPEDYCP